MIAYMTKYVLNSGGLSSYPEKTKAFFAELVKDQGNEPIVLICLFSRARERWEIDFLSFEENYPPLFPNDVTPKLVMAVPDQFEQQVAQADIILLAGGDDHLLTYWLQRFDIPNMWEGKVVAGSSAGSIFLSTHSWTCDWRECIDGFGIVPVKIIPHFNSTYGNDDPRGPIDWEKAKEELVQYGDTSLPIHIPEEGDFIVIEQ